MISSNTVRYYEFGLKIALPVLMVFLYLFPVYLDWIPLYGDWLQGKVPYGVLWIWFNPWYWTRDTYTYFIFAVIVGQTLVNWAFVKMGKMPKHLFYAGWITSLIWLRTGVYQNVTVTLFAPLAAVYPVLTVLLVMQKLPLGWSFPDVTANAHWQCAFNGTQPYSDLWSPGGLQCSAPWVRTDVFLPYFYSYLIIGFWALHPLVVYWRNRHAS